MDAEELRQLASNVSSDDLAVSRDAKRRLEAALTPVHIKAMLQDPASAQVLAALLGEVEEVGNPDVYHLLGGTLKQLFLKPSDEVKSVLFAPASQFLLDFIVRSAASAETVIAASVATALQNAIAALPHQHKGDTAVGEAAAAHAGRMLDEHFHNERVLRLLNCDEVESPDNVAMCSFLDQHTSLLSFLLDATQGAFANDPLLLANYLVASGVVCRTVAIPPPLRHITLEVLRIHDDALYYAFVCRFWSVALLHHEDNATRDAAACVSAVMPVVLEHARDEEATEAAFDLLGAAVSTQCGWDATTGLLSCESLQMRLRSTSASLRLSTLNLMLSMLNSPHVVPSFFSKDVMLDAWQTRTTPDDAVRLALWRVVLKALQFDVLETILAAVCASFLCSGAYEEDITVRTMKLQAADYLMKHSTLPENVKTRLGQYLGRGLYPAGSSGVSLMTKE